MSSKHLGALLLSLILYIILGLAYYGWGKLLIYATTSRHSRKERVPATFFVWIGWAVTLFLYQLIHLFIPISLQSVAPIILLGVGITVGSLIRQRRRENQTTRSSKVAITQRLALCILPVLILLIAAWLASRAMLPPTNFDSGLYHFNTIRWINTFPLMPGLGNLQGRLAFNQSYFTYVAALNLHPLFGHGRSIANSFIWLLTLHTLAEMMMPVHGKNSVTGRLATLQWLSALFCLPMLAYWALSSDGIQSPSPDLTSSLLQVTMFVMFCRAITGAENKFSDARIDFITLLLLGATAITIKLSSIAFCGVIMLTAWALSLRTSGNHMVDHAKLLIPPVLILVLHCARGWLLSGAPLFPSTIGYLSAEWSVPRDRIINEANWIYSWARQPGPHWRNVLGDWRWLDSWYDRVASDVTTIVYPVTAFLVVSIVHIVAALAWSPRSLKWSALHGMLLLPTVAGLAFWFLSAPEPRFANAQFLLLPVTSCVILAAAIMPRVNRQLFIIFAFTLLMAGNGSVLHWTYHHSWNVKQISVDGYQEVKQVPLRERVTKSGLRVFTPLEGKQCWDAPLPCTDCFNESLRLIDPENPASGFTVWDEKDNKGNAE